MIVCRKPITLFDVDLIGITSLASLLLAAYLGVIRPALANAEHCRNLALQIEAANEKATASSDRLSAIHEQINALRNGVETQTQQAPNIDALQPFLTSAAGVALQCGVSISQMAPNPAKESGDYLSVDISFTGRGGSLAFAAMLDQLSCDNPYFSLLEYSIKASRDGDEAACDLAWKLRLHMLKTDYSEQEEAAS